MDLAKSHLPNTDTTNFDILLEAIATDIAEKGYSIQTNAVPKCLADRLRLHMLNMPEQKFREARIGRQLNRQRNDTVRNDEIAWIHGNSSVGLDWIEWTQGIKLYLNRRLFLGLFSFESHFAHYAIGNFYKRHLDAFKGQASRVLSLVTYLNPEWHDSDGGELIIYAHQGDKHGVKVMPEFGTLVIFLSEEFEHEVKPALRDRNSIAGWFRVNSSTAERVDPPA